MVPAAGAIYETVQLFVFSRVVKAGDPATCNLFRGTSQFLVNSEGFGMWAKRKSAFLT